MGLSSLIKDEDNKVIYQDSLPGSAPAFCKKPFAYVNGCKKTVRIADKDFNYIDYMEAWCGISCYTYRSDDALYKLRKQMQEAFDKITAA